MTSEKEVMFAVDILGDLRCNGTFMSSEDNSVYIYKKNDMIQTIDNFYFPIFDLKLHQVGDRVYLFVCSNEVTVYQLDENNACKPALIHQFAPNIYFDCVVSLNILDDKLLQVRSGDRHVAVFGYTLQGAEMQTEELCNEQLASIQFQPLVGEHNRFFNLTLVTDRDAALQFYEFSITERQLLKQGIDVKLPLVPDKLYLLTSTKVLYMTIEGVGLWDISDDGEITDTPICHYSNFEVNNFTLIKENLLVIIGNHLAIYDLQSQKYRLITSFKQFEAENCIFDKNFGLLVLGSNGIKRVKDLNELIKNEIDPMEVVRKMNQ